MHIKHTNYNPSPDNRSVPSDKVVKWSIKYEVTKREHRYNY